MGQQRRRLSRVPSLNSTLTWLLPDLVSQETVVAQFYDLLHNLTCEHGKDLDLIPALDSRGFDHHQIQAAKLQLILEFWQAMEQLLGLARSRDEAGRADVQRGVLRVVHSPQITKI